MPIGARRLGLAFRRLGLLQLDSVNVYERSHYLPLQARLGSYDRALLDRLTFRERGPVTEYWAHEAALIPVEDLPLWAWRKAEWRERDPWWGGWAHEHAALLDRLRRILETEGPLAASEIEDESANRPRGKWWDRSDAKRGLEAMLRRGDVVTAGRTRFERRYALPEQVLPEAVLRAPEVPREQAIRELVRRSATALGIGTVADLADYFRLRVHDTRRAVRALEEVGELMRVRVAGWHSPVWIHHDARRPRRIETGALLSPFDPLVWDRARVQRHWDFHYRIEIYTPAHRRVHGYYSLPILLDERLVGRVDLKSDRRARVLRVQSAWREEGSAGAAADPTRVAALLREAAAWQGLEDVEVAARGTLAGDLRAGLG